MATKIDPILAKALIRKYQAQNVPATPTSQIITDSGLPLKGFYVDRASIEAILADATFTGIHFYLAKHPNHLTSMNGAYTMVFAGSKPNPAFVAGANTPQYLNDGDPYEYVDPCPTECGDLGS